MTTRTTLHVTLRWLLMVVATVLVASSLLLLPLLAWPTTFFVGDGFVPIVTVTAGLCVLAVGLVIVATRPWWSIGPVLLAAAVLWFSPMWAAWTDGPPVIAAVGLVAVGLLTPTLVHLAIAFPDGGLPERKDRLVVRGGYAVAGLAAAALAAFYDPFLDARCWANCSDNAFVILPLPQVAAITGILAAVAMGGLLGYAMVRAVQRVGRASASRRVDILVAAAVALLLVAGAIEMATRVAGGPVGPASAAQQAGRLALDGGGILLATAFAWQLAHAHRRRLAIDKVVRTASADPSTTIETALRTALNDPDLTVRYRLEASEGLVDAGGHKDADMPDDLSGRSTVDATRPAAVIRHRGAAVDLERELGPAMRVALENEALRVEVDVQLATLQSARAEVVGAGDRRRRELERALHDGAQQRLIVLAFRLRALADAARSEHQGSSGGLDRAVELARNALEELRLLAHGIHPTVLEHGGLPAALSSLANEAPIPVELASIDPRRAPGAVELSAYLLVRDCVADAYRREASHATVSVEYGGPPSLIVRVSDDADSPPDVVERTRDRIGAIGGVMRVDSREVRAELPCVL